MLVIGCFSTMTWATSAVAERYCSVVSQGASPAVPRAGTCNGSRVRAETVRMMPTPVEGRDAGAATLRTEGFVVTACGVHVG
jgi:hypothetical protein